MVKTTNKKLGIIKISEYGIIASLVKVGAGKFAWMANLDFPCYGWHVKATCGYFNTKLYLWNLEHIFIIPSFLLVVFATSF